MCGIVGFIGRGDLDTISNMARSIEYRGPDNVGTYYNEGVGLGQVRLSIIDIESRSNQPFFSDDKRYSIVFNGEIYNYLEVKEALLKTNKYTFRTTSDTEVLLYSFIEYGVDCLKKIDGMFAFTVFDFKSKELFMARDRMGKKPLYYSYQNNTFVFASEPKAIFCHNTISKELNVSTLNKYLTFDYVPSPDSMYSDVHKLEPSSYLVFGEDKKIKIDKYWEVDFSESDISFQDATKQLDELLSNAVKNRLVSDVPLGVFLSGGLDSSAIAYYAQKNSVNNIQTFSVGFNEKSYDESDYARLVAKHLGTKHHEQILTPQKSLDLIPEIMNKMDEPFADASIIPTYYLSKFTRSHVTVALGGDGSDEIFAGYPTFISEKYASLFRSIPSIGLDALRGLSRLLPVSDNNISVDFKINQFLKGFEESKRYTHSLWLGSFTPQQKKLLLNSDIRAELNNANGLDPVDYFSRDVASQNHFNKLLYVYCRTYLLDDILYKVDRASMFNSLEVRAPFLDTKVIEFANRLPRKYKIKGVNVKYILKNLMRDKLPLEIIDRPKKGFGIPLSGWIRKELKDEVNDVLLQKDCFFNPQYIQNLLSEHHSGKRNHRKLIWNLFVFKLWHKNQF
ncbi:MAG: asparagine synthase (glutamine-hydrolyzing) [Flavobacteriales bacterium]|nr:asparagine synthase (glutamine-hydrolyzing) [Flavobacteriales bacterium]